MPAKTLNVYHVVSLRADGSAVVPAVLADAREAGADPLPAASRAVLAGGTAAPIRYIPTNQGDCFFCLDTSFYVQARANVIALSLSQINS